MIEEPYRWAHGLWPLLGPFLCGCLPSRPEGLLKQAANAGRLRNACMTCNAHRHRHRHRPAESRGKLQGADSLSGTYIRSELRTNQVHLLYTILDRCCVHVGSPSSFVQSRSDGPYGYPWVFHRRSSRHLHTNTTISHTRPLKARDFLCFLPTQAPSLAFSLQRKLQLLTDIMPSIMHHI